MVLGQRCSAALEPKEISTNWSNTLCAADTRTFLLSWLLRAMHPWGNRSQDGVESKEFIPKTFIAAARMWASATNEKNSSHAATFLVGSFVTCLQFITFLSWYSVAPSMADDVLYNLFQMTCKYGPCMDHAWCSKCTSFNHTYLQKDNFSMPVFCHSCQSFQPLLCFVGVGTHNQAATNTHWCKLIST